jgi:branched-chain amino acid aminotransferase
MFVEACYEVVKRNIEYVPPYESGASLYLRPILIGTRLGLGVKASPEAMLVVYCSPVGPYFKGGVKAIKVIVDRMQDRAAPRGTGDTKVGGNYGSSILSGEKAHTLGYSNVMYLDAVEHNYIEECGAANFFGIKDGKYITPKSPSILPSITNKSLRTLAEDMGLQVEERPIPVSELKTFEEAGACGTAAVISPIERIDDLEKGTSYVFAKDGKPGPVCTALYNKLRAIQYGDEPDTHGWVTVLDI